MGGQPQTARGHCRQLHLLDRPCLTRRRIAAHMRRGKAIELRIEGRMHRHQLALQMGRQLGDLQAFVGQHALDVVAIGLAVRRLLQIEEARVSRDLQTLVTQTRRPVGQTRQRVEWRRIAQELCQEDARPLDGSHDVSP
jgi:hypothetical protein